MKKSTKIITTAVALVLVMGFMVVGILAATSASASITASVNWTATAGLQFSFQAGTLGTKAGFESWYNAHEEQINNGETYDYTEGMIGDMGAEYHDVYTMNVDTSTSNTNANGSKTMNGSFCDPSNDGVNNPFSIVYAYTIKNNSDVEFGVDDEMGTAYIESGTMVDVVVTLTKYPVSNANVDVKYITRQSWFDATENTFGNICSESGSSTPASSYNVSWSEERGGALETLEIFVVLTLKDPDQSLANFDASISFAFSKA